MKTLDSLRCLSETSGPPNVVACSLVGEIFGVGALAMDKGQAEMEGPIFRDIRRHYCEYCGICRSKKSLIASHILSHHKDEMELSKVDEDGEVEKEKSTTCQECGVTFRKPAHLKQHMQSHSLERPYMC